MHVSSCAHLYVSTETSNGQSGYWETVSTVFKMSIFSQMSINWRAADDTRLDQWCLHCSAHGVVPAWSPANSQTWSLQRTPGRIHLFGFSKKNGIIRRVEEEGSHIYQTFTRHPDWSSVMHTIKWNPGLNSSTEPHSCFYRTDLIILVCLYPTLKITEMHFLYMSE